MTAMPQPHQAVSTALNSLLTVDQYLALGETEPGYTELLEGRLLMSPSPSLRHNRASGRLLVQLLDQLPDELDVVQDLDLDLAFGPADEPGYVRRPDLIIYQRTAADRIEAEGGIIRAAEVVVVVEIVSPGSKRTDRVAKHGEYADAGIPHYWILDLTKPTSLLPCHRAQDGYEDGAEVTGNFAMSTPFPLTLDLTKL